MCIETTQNALQLWRKFLKGKMGQSLQDDRTVRMDATQIKIKFDQPVYPQADGESIAKVGVTELEYSVLPKALKMLTLVSP